MLAVAGGKGGCGKTTTALGVAAALAADAAADRTPILVADADRDMPDLHTLADTDRTPTLVDAAERRTDPRAIASPADEAVAPGVGVLPAPKGIAGPATGHALARLSTAVDVVDCPAGAGPDAVGPLRAATAVLLVARATRESLRDAVKTAAMARELDCDPVGAVLTRTGTVPDGVPSGLGVGTCEAVPEATGRPLSDPAVRAAYRRLVRAAEVA